MRVHKTAEEAVSFIKSYNRVFVHGGAAVPQALLNALVKEADQFRDVELMHLHTQGSAEYAKPEYAANFRVANLFIGKNLRPYVDNDRIDYLPCFLSEVPALIRSGHRPIDVALIHVSPPDKHGYCSLGISVDVTDAAVGVAKMVIAQINPQMPRVLGDGFIHIDRIDHCIYIDEALPEVPRSPLQEDEKKIGSNVASLVEDGATLQIGIGSIPDAVLTALKKHKHLGIHSEMWSDGALELIERGVVDNSQKRVYPGQTVSGFIIGTKKLYDFVHDNPSVIQLDIAYVNAIEIITQNPKVTAINSAVEIDLTGQVCADSVGSRIISGVGGQMDFIRAASLSPEGKPIIALTSRSRKGIPRIVSKLKAGAGVVTTRAHVHYIVTEYGITNLYGKTLRERAKALISLAHPADREQLEKEWYEQTRR